MARKPFKETKLGKFLASKGLDQALGMAGDVIPGIKILDKIKDAVLGNDPETAELEQVVNLTPEERAHILELIQAEKEQLEMILADVKDARGMQVAALQQEDKFSKRFVYYFITAWSLFSMVFILITTLCEIPEQNMRMVDTTQGFLLGTAIAAMFAFLLGSTHRSRQKDETIANLAR